MECSSISICLLIYYNSTMQKEVMLNTENVKGFIKMMTRIMILVTKNFLC